MLKRVVLFLTCVLPLIASLHADTTTNPVDTHTSFIAELKDLGVDAQLKELSYEEVCQVYPELQETWWTRIFNPKKEQFQYFKAYELVLHNQKNKQYLFSPKDTSLPFVSYEEVNKTVNHKDFMQKLLTFSSFISIALILVEVLIPLRHILRTAFFMTGFLAGEYFAKDSLFNEQEPTGIGFVISFFAATAVLNLLTNNIIMKAIAHVNKKHFKLITVEVLVYIFSYFIIPLVSIVASCKIGSFLSHAINTALNKQAVQHNALENGRLTLEPHQEQKIIIFTEPSLFTDADGIMYGNIDTIRRYRQRYNNTDESSLFALFFTLLFGLSMHIPLPNKNI